MSEARKKKSRGLRLLFLSLGMVVLIAALILVIQYQKRQEEAAESEKESSSFVYKDLWDYDETELSSIEIKRADETVTIYAREGRGDVIWYQEEYPTASLNSSLYPNLVALGCKLSVYQVVKEDATEQEKAEYGLKNPYAQIRFNLKDGTSHTIFIGDATTTGNYAYILEEESGIIYSTGKSCRTYAAYTSEQLYLTDIKNVYTTYTLSYLFLQKKGEKAVEIGTYDSSKDPDNYFNSNTIYRFLQPYDYKYVGVDSGLQSKIFDELEDISIHEVLKIQATDEELEAYGLGLEPEYRVNIVTCNEETSGEIKEFETDYIFGYTYGENNEYVYFRQNGESIVYGVDIASLEQFSFNSKEYAQQLIYLSNIQAIQSGTVEVNGTKYSYELEQETDESDEISYKVRMNGKDVTEEKFKTALRNLFMIMRDNEFWTDSMDYDDSDKVVITYQFLDGTEKNLTYYRYNEFSYVIEVQEGLWMTCNYYQFKTMQQAFEDALAGE